MQTNIYKLAFTTPARFGIDGFSADLSRSDFTCRADTFFSAVCQAWLKLYGEQSLADFVGQAEQGGFLLSDLFPYAGEELYLPKPKLIVERNDPDDAADKKYDKKIMKKLKYIPVTGFAGYIAWLKGGAGISFVPEITFAKELLTVKSAVSGLADSRPYAVSAHVFNKNCGLYFLAQTTDRIKEKLDDVLNVLGDEGIGGKKSAGFGKFCLAKESSDIALEQLLNAASPYYMSLSCICPSAADLDGLDTDRSFYRLIKRSGFIHSFTYSGEDFVKKQETYMFEAGSCFSRKLDGVVADAAGPRGGAHPVYRYGKGLFLGAPL